MTEIERVMRKSGGGWPYAVCAMVLVAGGLMPVLTAGEAEFSVSFPVMTTFDSAQTWPVRVAAAAPIVAWLAVSITLMVAKGLVRPLLMHVYALIVWIALFTLPATQQSLTAGLDVATKGVNGLWPAAGGLGLIALTLAYAGNRVRAWAPENRLAAAAGALAPVYLIFALIYPFDWPEIGFMSPVHLMAQEEGVWSHQMIGFFQMLAMLVLGAAALIALGNTADTPAAHAKARLALRVWWFHLALLVLGVALVPLFLRYDSDLPWSEVIAAAANLFRSAMLTLGWLFLLLCSSAELVAQGVAILDRQDQTDPTDQTDQS